MEKDFHIRSKRLGMIYRAVLHSEIRNTVLEKASVIAFGD